jgi:hypothetical protein
MLSLDTVAPFCVKPFDVPKGTLRRVAGEGLNVSWKVWSGLSGSREPPWRPGNWAIAFLREFV